jgi:hypothetical protein
MVTQSRDNRAHHIKVSLCMKISHQNEKVEIQGDNVYRIVLKLMTGALVLHISKSKGRQASKEICYSILELKQHSETRFLIMIFGRTLQPIQ